LARVPDTASAYQARISRLLDCLIRVERARDQRDLNSLDVDLLYESTFLTAVALFEVMLEDILVEAVCGPRGTRRGSFPLVTARSRDRFRTVLRQGRAYNDFMPFNRAIDLATYYVNGAMPFSAVTASDRTLLSEISWTRNAIAHRSEAASKKFRESVPGVASLLRNRQRPGPFLRFQFRANPNQTRSDLYLGALGRISSEIALAW
jgi:hypothetical protein